MNKFLLRAGGMALLAASMAGPAFDASAIGWPSKYQGVMLQGFYWDSYTDSKWTNLEAQADELSQYFKLIWIPNSGKAGTGNQMGYMPQYWFTNHNSSFGTEAQLLSMIAKYKEKGTGFIADVVINHRNGVTNWYDFPTETWNGKTWKIGLEGICQNDEMANAAGQPKPTGNYDTGENFDGCRDLDHTNANVQDNCKNYLKCLKEKYGYVGARYDMVKGYGGQYNKIYNQYANVEYSVGEYWDGQYDAVAGWIEATGKTSAAFDFPLKYCLNEAFSSNDMTKLVWKANGTTNQPAGLIHFGYPRYSVTFVDNHDTYRDGSKFTGNVLAANAFILMSPGTPCVFLPHYKANKAAIQTLINIRNSAGIHNESPVTVLQSTGDCYMAEVTGTKGKVVVKVGSSMASPAGYSNSDIKASGNGYCVWTKVNVQGGNSGGGGGGDVVDTPAKLYLMGNVKGAQWSTSASPAMTKSGDTFTITATFEKAAGETQCYFNFSDALGTTWDVLNATANRYGAASDGVHVNDNSSVAITSYLNGVDASDCKSWTINPGTYKLTVDFKTMKLTIGANQGGGGGDDPIDDDDPTMPAKFYILGEAEGKTWACNDAVEMEKSGNTFTKVVEFQNPTKPTDDAFFSFAKSLGATWDLLNVAGNRFAPAADKRITPDGADEPLVESSNPSSAKAYFITPGKYLVKVDWKNKKISVSSNLNSAVEEIEVTDEAPAIYFNLQGQRVENPAPGAIYIRVKGNKAEKILVR